MSKHTPGPWHVDQDINGLYVAAEAKGGDAVARIYTWHHGQEANARLIAAAPAMYEALKAARYVIDGTTPVGKMIEAALSEANGTQK